MAGAIIWYTVMFGSAILFVAIGVYARRLEKPMWFWSGSTVDAATISDVKAYNKENAKMWMLYSLWYWGAGFLWAVSQMAALVLLVLGCTIGIGILIRTFLKIEKKYKKTGL